jgi:pyruvate carboxylase
MYAPFECGMKSGTARVYDHEIPGGQYSNLMVQCQAMGIWDKWEHVLNAYRDVNVLLGDVVKVTPSSKCVGDLAIYLVTRGLSVADVLDEGKAAGIDFPASVIELLEGRLGFPHRGFPAQVQKAILKGRPPLSVAPSAALAPADFAAEKLKLDNKWGIDATPEDVISSLLYPKVCLCVWLPLFRPI